MAKRLISKQSQIYWSVAWRMFLIAFGTIVVILYTYQLGINRGYQFGLRDAALRGKTQFSEVAWLTNESSLSQTRTLHINTLTP